jgi:hypothetical protein
VGALPQQLAADLRDRLGLTRAIETGTYRGGGTRRLASIFPRVITVEISEELARAAAESLADRPGIEVRQGTSRDVLPTIVDPTEPTLYWLDGHWSGGVTGGKEDECPVLAELEGIAGGHPDDVVLIDDARLFLAPPPAPHDPTQWPDVGQLIEALARAKPGHKVLVAHDIVVAVPDRAADLAASFAHGAPPKGESRVRRLSNRLRG